MPKKDSFVPYCEVCDEPLADCICENESDASDEEDEA